MCLAGKLIENRYLSFEIVVHAEYHVASVQLTKQFVFGPIIDFWLLLYHRQPKYCYTELSFRRKNARRCEWTRFRRGNCRTKRRSLRAIHRDFAMRAFDKFHRCDSLVKRPLTVKRENSSCKPIYRENKIKYDNANHINPPPQLHPTETIFVGFYSICVSL